MSKSFGFVGLLFDYLTNIRMTINLGQEKMLHEKTEETTDFLGSLNNITEQGVPH